jgi:hypothetical protein
VNHSAKEYVRGHVHTNSAEGLFSIFKRGTTEKHLHRYLTETSSATITASSLVSAILTALLPQCAVSRAGASCTGNLTEPVYKFKAGRFMRWRRKNRKRAE